MSLETYEIKACRICRDACFRRIEKKEERNMPDKKFHEKSIHVQSRVKVVVVVDSLSLSIPLPLTKLSR